MRRLLKATMGTRLKRRSRALAALALLAGLAACASDPSFKGAEPIGNARLARAHLGAMVDNGPVPAELRQVPASLGPDATVKAAASGIQFLKPVFEPVVVPPARIQGARLVLWFNGPRVAADVCAGRNTIQPIPRRRPELSAAWCEGPTAVAGIVGEAADSSRAALERLVWQATGRLFPDTYADDAGLDFWGMKVRPGGSFGF